LDEASFASLIHGLFGAMKWIISVNIDHEFTGWWFGTFFILPNSWDDYPI
jgi:hypothetical protein